MLGQCFGILVYIFYFGGGSTLNDPSKLFAGAGFDFGKNGGIPDEAL